jgi:very-short-patch-repair endonuclease
VRESISTLGIDTVREFRVDASTKRDVFDLYVPAFNLLIECDGRYWHSKPDVKRRDVAKTKRARALGYRVTRLPEDLIKSPAIHTQLLRLLTQQSLL